MELQFQKVNENEWVAEFQATADFNLHIERVSSGSITVAQRGTESGEYDTAWAKGVYEGQRVIDYDFGALVYPKWIKVTSSSEVVSCVVNFSAGGGSGTGGGSGEAASTMEYLDVSGVDGVMLTRLISTGVPYAKAEKDGIVMAAPSSALSGAGMLVIECIKAVAIDKTATVAMLYGTNAMTMTFVEALAQSGITQEQLDAIPRITKEQFYTI